MIKVINSFLNLFSYKEFLSSAKKLAELKNTIKNLEETIQTQNTLLNNVSHEIRTPMHGICNISEFLNDYWYTLNEFQKKSQIQSITDISIWLKNFISNLLDISQFQAGKMKFNFIEIDLLTLIKDTINYCQKTQLFNNSKLKIDFNYNGFNHAKLIADPFRVRQLLQNLFDNAIKYTNEGRIIVNITAITYNNYYAWQFDIVDEGIGIPQNELKIIFDSFIRSPNKYGLGTGLGLSICREIVEAHGGHIWAEHNKYRNEESNNSIDGAIFSFVLPVNNSSFNNKDNS